MMLLLGWFATAQGQIPSDLELRPVASGFSSPLLLTHAGDGSGRLFVVEQGGTIRIIHQGQVLPTPFLDIHDRVLAGGERGLLGLAFAPDYADSGRFFVSYTALVNNVTTSRLSRFTRLGPDQGDANSEVILLSAAQPANNHNGGHIAFGPDGYLYIALGDGGASNDFYRQSQDLSTLLGALLRVDVAGSGLNIPADNPFIGVVGAQDEIWALGLRNPWRFSFDRNNGDLWIGDVGQGAREEINRQLASSDGGENYGWPCREGTIATPNPPAGVTCDGTLTEPLLDYSLSGSQSVTGGYRYRGAIPGLQGVYIFGDYVSGQIWFATAPDWNPMEWQDSDYFISSFGEDEAGEVYLVDHGGAVYQFYSAAVAGAILLDGFE